MLLRDYKDMKLVVRVQDVVSLVRRFETSPVQAMCELKTHMQAAAQQVLERVMDTEIELFFGEQTHADNKRNGYIKRLFAFKRIGVIKPVF